MSQKELYGATGVIKFDFKVAGYKDLLKVAKKLAEDDWFQQIIIRSVSEKNLGIQFLYLKEFEREQLPTGKTFSYLLELRDEFGDWLYARDVECGNLSNETIKDYIIISKDISSFLQ